MKLTKKQQNELAMNNVRRIGEVSRILRQRRNCTPRHSIKVANRFVAIYGNGINK